MNDTAWDERRGKSPWRRKLRGYKADRALVLLIHGLWMNGLEFALLGRRLRESAYQTRRFHYPSMSASLDDNARCLGEQLANIRNRPLHIVAHSLGGLVALRAFVLHPELPVSRVVFMGVPVRGSSAARGLAKHALGSQVLGKAGIDVLAAAHQPKWCYAPELGVLAGTQPLGLGQLAAQFDGSSDGTVMVEETRLPGASDYVSVLANHMGMVISNTVAKQIMHFLRNGVFDHVDDAR